MFAKQVCINGWKVFMIVPETSNWKLNLVHDKRRQTELPWKCDHWSWTQTDGHNGMRSVRLVHRISANDWMLRQQPLLLSHLHRFRFWPCEWRHQNADPLLLRSHSNQPKFQISFSRQYLPGPYDKNRTKFDNWNRTIEFFIFWEKNANI